MLYMICSSEFLNPSNRENAANRKPHPRNPSVVSRCETMELEGCDLKKTMQLYRMFNDV